MTRKQGLQHLILILLLAVLGAIIALRASTDPFANATPPEVDTNGLAVHETVKATDTPVKPVETDETETETPVEPVYTMYFDEQDAIAVAQMLWGEAKGCTLADKQNCVRTVCNRVDDARFPDTPYAVVTQRCQYYGYSSSNPVDSELYEIAVAIMTDWSMSKQGVDCEWYSYNSFWGDGVQNHFYTV